MITDPPTLVNYSAFQEERNLHSALRVVKEDTKGN